jgi:MFS superfamily sulfate permease-like transporter
LLSIALERSCFYASINRFVDEVRALVKGAPTPIRWFIVDAGAITDLDCSAAQAMRELVDELTSQSVRMIFARANPYLGLTWTGTASRRRSAKAGSSPRFTKPSPRRAAVCWGECRAIVSSKILGCNSVV